MRVKKEIEQGTTLERVALLVDVARGCARSDGGASGVSEVRKDPRTHTVAGVTRTSLVVRVVWTRVTPAGVMVSGRVVKVVAVTHLDGISIVEWQRVTHLVWAVIVVVDDEVRVSVRPSAMHEPC